MKQKTDGYKLRGEFLIETRNIYTGEVIERELKKNLIVTAGLVEAIKLLGDVDTPVAFNAVAIGIGTTGAVAGNTTLESETVREAVVPTYEATAKILFENTFEFGSGDSYAITEAGIFNDESAGGDMLNRVTFAAKNVTSEIACYVKFTITASTS